MDAILDGSVSGLTLKRTMCSIICELVDILIGEMDGEDELRRGLKLKPREMGGDLSFDEDKKEKCVRVHNRPQIMLACTSCFHCLRKLYWMLQGLRAHNLKPNYILDSTESHPKLNWTVNA